MSPLAKHFMHFYFIKIAPGCNNLPVTGGILHGQKMLNAGAWGCIPLIPPPLDPPAGQMSETVFRCVGGQVSSHAFNDERLYSTGSTAVN